MFDLLVYRNSLFRVASLKCARIWWSWVQIPDFPHIELGSVVTSMGFAEVVNIVSGVAVAVPDNIEITDTVSSEINPSL